MESDRPSNEFSLESVTAAQAVSDRFDMAGSASLKIHVATMICEVTTIHSGDFWFRKPAITAPNANRIYFYQSVSIKTKMAELSGFRSS